jgi:hypothetical protein
MKKVKITLTVVAAGTPGLTGEKVLKTLEQAGFNVPWLVAQAYQDGMTGSVVPVKNQGGTSKPKEGT